MNPITPCAAFFLGITLANTLSTFHPVYASSQGAPMTVHEWGTFTTLTSSDGKPLPGLFVDASPLPSFVHSLPFFAGAPSPMHQGQSDLGKDSALAHKWQGVATKMETPVLYFYTDHPQSVPMQVNIDFPGGAIHQFYPPRQGGESNPAGPRLDFSQTRQGSIEWHAEILPQKLNESSYGNLTHPDGGGSQEWLAPRRPASNLIRAGGETESYLFYRGLAGVLDLPLRIRFVADSTLELTNAGPDSLAHIVVYDQAQTASLTQAGVVWWQGGLAPGATRRLPLIASETATDFINRQNAFDAMKAGLLAALQKAGLTLDEASAMLSTWDRSYWGDERGFKVFWIVPRAKIDALLPLRLTSSIGFNYEVERVFIARSEILMPGFERALRQGFAVEPTDRLRVAYQALLQEAFLPNAVPIRKRMPRALSHAHSGARVHSLPTYILVNGRNAGDRKGVRPWSPQLGTPSSHPNF